jgi:putative membrane protein
MPAQSFLDFVSLLLVNMVAGFVLLAFYVYFGLQDPDQKRWAPGFLLVGLVAVIFGGRIVMTWPLPGSFNTAYGESSVLFGSVYLAAGACLALSWGLETVVLYAFFAGLAAMVMGVRIFTLGLSSLPWLTAVGFLLSGGLGVCSAPVYLWLRACWPVRVLGALAALGAALVWAANAYPAYWMHLASFVSWKPR